MSNQKFFNLIGMILIVGFMSFVLGFGVYAGSKVGYQMCDYKQCN